MTERHFRVVQLDGKKVEIGGVSIKSSGSPGGAARKLLTSIAHHKGLKKNKKASMGKVKFCIQEFTQGSSKKVYGPYIGHYHKYSAAELKKAMTADGKVKFTMKPVVKLVKGNKKGGTYFSNYPPSNTDTSTATASSTDTGTYGKLNSKKVTEIKEYIAQQSYSGTFYIIKDIQEEGTDQKYIIHALNSMMNLVNHTIYHKDIKFKGSNSGLFIGDILVLNEKNTYFGSSTYTKSEELSIKSRKILAKEKNSKSPSSLLISRIRDLSGEKKKKALQIQNITLKQNMIMDKNYIIH